MHEVLLSETRGPFVTQGKIYPKKRSPPRSKEQNLHAVKKELWWNPSVVQVWAKRVMGNLTQDFPLFSLSCSHSRC